MINGLHSFKRSGRRQQSVNLQRTAGSYTREDTMNQFLSIRRRLHSDLGSCNYIGINLRPPDRGDAGAIWIKGNLLLFRGVHTRINSFHITLTVT